MSPAEPASRVPAPSPGHGPDELVSCVRHLNRRGWCDGTSGNFSLTQRRAPLRLLITPSGLDKGRLRPGDLLVVDETGQPVGATPHRPSAETALHVELVRRVGAAAILHTHSTWGTLLGERFLVDGGFDIRGYEMLKGLRGIETHEATVRVPVVRNSQRMDELAPEFARVLTDAPDTRGLLIAGHGLYTWGDDLDEARRHVEIFEFLFRLVGQRVGAVPWPDGGGA